MPPPAPGSWISRIQAQSEAQALLRNGGWLLNGEFIVGHFDVLEVRRFFENSPTCPDQSVAIRLGRDAVMTANIAIALDGLSISNSS